jgi:hypothetical protein
MNPDNYNILDPISLDVLNSLLAAKKLKTEFAKKCEWQEASVLREIEKRIEFEIGFSTYISELEVYIRERKIRLIIESK